MALPPALKIVYPSQERNNIKGAFSRHFYPRKQRRKYVLSIKVVICEKSRLELQVNCVGENVIRGPGENGLKEY